jgi:hypothetical protein
MAQIPQAGDVLVSKATATVEHVVSIVSGHSEDVALPTHEAAVAAARELAKKGHVDAWLTEDHTHYLKIASHRAG